MGRLRDALAAIDAALVAYARLNGGRFIRFGSTAAGRATPRSDVDVIADFPGSSAFEAAAFAEDVILRHGLTPDPWPVRSVAERVLARALEEGVVLA